MTTAKELIESQLGESDADSLIMKVRASLGDASLYLTKLQRTIDGSYRSRVTAITGSVDEASNKLDALIRAYSEER